MIIDQRKRISIAIDRELHDVGVLFFEQVSFVSGYFSKWGFDCALARSMKAAKVQG